MEAVVVMVAWSEKLTRRQDECRERIEELREQIAELQSRLEVEEDRLTRLVITQETMEELLGEEDEPVAESVLAVAEAAVSSEPEVERESVAVPRGVVTVPPWRPEVSVRELPAAYRDAVEIMADAGRAVRAGQILAAMGSTDEAAKREGLRSKLKRLVERGWAREDGPGLFTLTEQVAAAMRGGGAGGGVHHGAWHGSGSSPPG